MVSFYPTIRLDPTMPDVASAQSASPRVVAKVEVLAAVSCASDTAAGSALDHYTFSSKHHAGLSCPLLLSKPFEADSWQDRVVVRSFQRDTKRVSQIRDPTSLNDYHSNLARIVVDLARDEVPLDTAAMSSDDDELADLVCAPGWR